MKRKKGGKFSLKKELGESLKFIRESKFYIYAILVLFVLSALIAAFVPAPASIQNQIKEIIQNVLKQTEGMNFLHMFVFILLNNLKSSFLGMVSGILFGIPTIIVCIINGYFLGFVAMMSVNSDGILVLWKIFPHGIFELPAIFISLGFGLKMGLFLFNKKKNEKLADILLKCVKVFILVVLPLLIVAGLIESLLIFLVS